MKKLLAMSITLALVVSMFSACGDNAANSSEGASSSSGSSSSGSSSQAASSGTEAVGITYPLEGNPKLTLVASENAYVLNSYATWQETPFIEAWAEQTGVDLEASFVSDFSVYLASGDYADIIVYGWNGYSGGAAKAISDGIIIGIEDYVEEFAPDYWKVLNSDPNYLKGTMTSAGNMVGFYNVRTEPARISWGAYTRGDWLEDLNMEVPTTIDEFTAMLNAFKEEKDASIPFGATLGTLQGMGGNGILTSAFGLARTDYYQLNGTIHYGPFEDTYKDYVTYLSQLYADGLLDTNILTVDDTTVKSNMMNSVSGFTAGTCSGQMGSTMQQMASVDPNYQLVPVGSLVKNAGERAMYSNYSGYLNPTAAAITTSCKDVETAMKFLNYGYSEKGNLLMYYGIEGISFEMIDDYPYFTDFVKNNPDGLTFPQALSLYDYSPSVGPYISNGDYSLQTYSETQLHALELWSDTDAKKYFVPAYAISVSEEHMGDYSSIKSEVDTCVNEYFSKFVTGEYPIGEKWDEYISTLKSMGIDTMIQYYQEAYDEYQSR